MKSLCHLLAAFLILAAAAPGAEKRPIVSGGAKPVGPYSPGILAGDYLYVSGQGALDAQGKMPQGFDDQVRVTLDNVKSIVEAAGLTMEHVVYTQVYLARMANLEALDRIWPAYFRGAPPARSVLGVARMPKETPVEVTAVAVRDLSRKKAVPGGGILTGDRLYIPGVFGRDPATGAVPGQPAAEVQLALDNVERLLKAAGLDFRHVVFVNPYLTRECPMGAMNEVYAKRFEFGNTPARATIQVNELPYGTRFEFTGVAVVDLSQRRAVRPKNMPPSPTASPCVFAGDTFYCSAKSAFIPGPNQGIYAPDVELQVRQSLRNLLDGLEEAGLDFSHVVATNVYLDNVDEFDRMNRIYGSYFPGAPPTRTTVQPLPPVERKPDARGRWPMVEQISLIAVR